MVGLKVEVVVALPREESILKLDLPEGATVRDAMARAGLRAQSVGIFGERVAPGTRLADGDRVEIYRPLDVDPKEVRRRRAKR